MSERQTKRKRCKTVERLTREALEFIIDGKEAQFKVQIFRALEALDRDDEDEIRIGGTE